MGGIHKILHPLCDTTVLHQGLRALNACESIAQIVIVCRAQDTDDYWRSLAEIEYLLRCPVTIVPGGQTRQQSVRNGFAAISGKCEYVAIHDGARPLIRPADVERVIADARRTGAATLGAPVKDTIKIVQNGCIIDTPDRTVLWHTQTPQVFRSSLYEQAMEFAQQQGKDYTDDCQLVEALGTKVTMTAGSYDNIKLTTPEDFAVAEALLTLQQKEDTANG